MYQLPTFCCWFLPSPLVSFRCPKRQYSPGPFSPLPAAAPRYLCGTLRQIIDNRLFGAGAPRQSVNTISAGGDERGAVGREEPAVWNVLLTALPRRVQRCCLFELTRLRPTHVTRVTGVSYIVSKNAPRFRCSRVFMVTLLLRWVTVFGSVPLL